MVRKFVCCLMLALYPASLIAADGNAAMLHVKGNAWLNGAPVPASVAVFSGDMVQTDANAAAQITGTGSSVSVLPGSLVTFEGKSLGVNHGSVMIATSRQFPARVGTLTIAPASDAWTEFRVDENEGSVRITAQKGDLTVSDGASTSTLHSGQQATRTNYASKGGQGAQSAGTGGLLDSRKAMWAGILASGALIGWALSQGSEPLSRSVP